MLIRILQVVSISGKRTGRDMTRVGYVLLLVDDERE